MHAHKPYRARVLANRDFMDALIIEAGRSGSDLVRAVAAAEERTTALGTTEADPSTAVVTWRDSGSAETLTWPAYRRTIEDSVVTGGTRVVYHRGELDTVELPWRHTVEPDLEVSRPRGYLVHAGWPQLEEAVRNHGLEAHPLTAAVTLEVETIRLQNPSYGASPFQGAFMVTDVEVSRQPEEREIPAGSLWIPADQPDFQVAVQLFEPEAPDSLLRWGELSSVFEMKTYIGLDRLEELAVEMLRDDELRAEWETALEDPEFAGDRQARYIWWYHRTPYWDEQLCLLPIYRVMEPPPFEATEG
jgi:hypothetical protein